MERAIDFWPWKWRFATSLAFRPHVTLNYTFMELLFCNGQKPSMLPVSIVICCLYWSESKQCKFVEKAHFHRFYVEGKHTLALWYLDPSNHFYYLIYSLHFFLIWNIFSLCSCIQLIFLIDRSLLGLSPRFTFRLLVHEACWHQAMIHRACRARWLSTAFLHLPVFFPLWDLLLPLYLSSHSTSQQSCFYDHFPMFCISVSLFFSPILRYGKYVCSLVLNRVENGDISIAEIFKNNLTY